MNTESAQRASPAAAKPAKVRKFRSSCDACSACKVKCDQGQPQCLRCVNLGVRCNYSPSRRMGKPPASSRKLTNTSNPATGKADQDKSRPVKKRQRSPSSFINVSRDQTSVFEQDQSSFDPAMTGSENFMAMNWQDDLFQMSTYDVPSSTDVQLTASSLFDLNFDFTTDQISQLPNNNPFCFSDESIDTCGTPSRDPVFEPMRQVTSQFSHSTTETSPSASLLTPKLCTHQADIGCHSPPSPIFRTNTSIDQVLINNKAAIENAYSLLACPCSQNPHFALSLALICNKILATYEAVIQASSTPNEPTLSSSHDSDSPRVPITVGAYKMDAEDEERMRIQIVVNELRKVKGLVDTYAKKYCYGGSGPKNDAGGGIYSALENFLRSRLTTTLQELLTRLEC